jgi:hypothetical protein
MQQIMIYWQSINPRLVSGVFTPIVRRELHVTAYGFLSCYGCCGFGESGGEMCARCRGFVSDSVLLSIASYQEDFKPHQHHYETSNLALLFLLTFYGLKPFAVLAVL